MGTQDLWKIHSSTLPLPLKKIYHVKYVKGIVLKLKKIRTTPTLAKDYNFYN